MAITLINIAATQLASGGSTLFAGSTTKVNLYFRPGAAAPGRLISPKNLQLPANAQVVLDAEVVFGTTGGVADTLYATSTNSSTVDCVISAMQRDL